MLGVYALFKFLGSQQLKDGTMVRLGTTNSIFFFFLIPRKQLLVGGVIGHPESWTAVQTHGYREIWSLWAIWVSTMGNFEQACWKSRVVLGLF